MCSCESIERIVTSYIDGEASGAEADAIEQHLRVCEPCRMRIGAERAAHGLLKAKALALRDEHAPGALHARCRLLAAGHRAPAPAIPFPIPAAIPSASPSRWRSIARPMALAASLVFVVVGAFLYRMTHTSELVIARELT